MKSKNLAAVYYSAGYAKVKLYATTKGLKKDEAFLRQALRDMDRCFELDPENYKAQRARKKLQERLRPTSIEGLLEKVGPITILLASGFVFVLTQVSFIRGGHLSDLRFYVPMTFGSLILMIAGLYLPRLLKLKVAGIELEKSSVDQIIVGGGSIEISK
jgi:hypothetical protein